MPRTWTDMAVGNLVPGDTLKIGDDPERKIKDVGVNGKLAVMVFEDGQELSLFPGMIVSAYVSDLFEVVFANQIQVGDVVRMVGTCEARRDNTPPGEVTLQFPGRMFSVPYEDSTTSAQIVKRA